MRKSRLVSILIVCALALAAHGVCAQEASESDLAKKTQNPISDLISLPFQNNTDFRFGPNNRTRNVLNIQPVWPFKVHPRWNLVTRTIAPLISLSESRPGDGTTFGLGDILFTAWLSPTVPGPVVWGLGVAAQFPTAADEALGTEKWSAGPSAVVLGLQGPWVYGGLIQNIWSFAGSNERANVDQLLLQPFVNYNLAQGWYLVSAPINTANWEASADNVWTVPIGAGVGKVSRLGALPINISVHGYYNIEKPKASGAVWQLRAQLQLLFPK